MKMKRLILAILVLVCGSFFILSPAMADSVDNYITQLKSDDSGVRAHAAQELGCG
jgi:hypothetical protein